MPRDEQRPGENQQGQGNREGQDDSRVTERDEERLEDQANEDLTNPETPDRPTPPNR